MGHVSILVKICHAIVLYPGTVTMVTEKFTHHVVACHFYCGKKKKVECHVFRRDDLCSPR